MGTNGDKLGQMGTNGQTARRRIMGDKRKTRRQTETNRDRHWTDEGIELEDPHKPKIAKHISLCPRDVSRTGTGTFRRVSQVPVLYE